MTPKYPIAERFKAPQGEGLYTGTPMAFVRMVGCSVGQKVCTACDTLFDRMLPEMGGGSYTVQELVGFTQPYRRACITGGEPLDRDLRPLLLVMTAEGITCHLETSGTRRPDWLMQKLELHDSDMHVVKADRGDMLPVDMWLCVSPKPGYREDMIELADEVKVIIGGLGDGPGWPTIEDAVRWADGGKLVYVQQRNYQHNIDRAALDRVLDLCDQHPQLRLSVQLHKFLETR